MKTLWVGYRAADFCAAGKRPARGQLALPAGETGDVFHVLDVYCRHAFEKLHHVRSVCSPHLPEGPWDLIRFRTGPKIMSGELALDLMQEVRTAVGGDLKAAKGRWELDYVGRESDRNALLEKVTDRPGRIRSFKAVWEASVPGGERLKFVSSPGCFCHRRLDEGGLALAEVVSQELLSPPEPSPAPLKLLDMGCGCGLVGLLVANRLKVAGRPTPETVLVDSHSRAVEAAQENAAAQGVAAEVILSDSGTPERLDGTFDVFVGNPPYYSDYRIAEVFLQTAVRALKPGGVAYQVVKNPAGLEPVQKRFFPEVQVINRRGYAVLKSRKSQA